MNYVFCPQVDLVTGLAIEEACYAQVCNTVTFHVDTPYKICLPSVLVK